MRTAQNHRICDSCHAGENTEDAIVRVKGDIRYREDHDFNDLCGDHYSIYIDDGYNLTIVTNYTEITYTAPFL